METELILELPNDLRAIEHAVDYVVRHCTAWDAVARKLRLNLRVGLAEALSNAMLYGNRQDPGKRVRIEVTVHEGEIMARITDEGEGFDPETVPDPTEPENIEKPCGRGLFLMRELLDEVRFNDRGNAVTLVLRLAPGDLERLASGGPGRTAVARHPGEP